MSKNEFDRLLKEQFDQHEFAYSPANWEKLAGQLPASGSRRISILPWLKPVALAAGLALLLGSVAVFSLFRENTQPDSLAQIKQSGKPDPAGQTTMAPQPPAPEPEPSASQPVITRAGTTVKQPATGAAISAVPEPLVTAPQNNKAAQQAIAIKENSQPAGTGMMDQAATPLSPSPTSAITPERASQTLAGTLPEPDVKPRQSRGGVSLAAGMNFGSLNTGYMAGINARQRLGRKTFVEGDLAVVGNTASKTFTQTAFTPQPGSSARGAAIDYRSLNLVYVQFNPTLGYQVHKQVSVGIGADLQRMVNGDNTLVNVDEEIKTIPGTDVGLTGKTEIALSRRLKAGVLYREGINNFLNSSAEYFDRRYIQVQFKFRVTGN